MHASRTAISCLVVAVLATACVNTVDANTRAADDGSGDNDTVSGDNDIVTGDEDTVSGDGDAVSGDGDAVSGDVDALPCGDDNAVIGDTGPCVKARYPESAFWQEGANHDSRRIIDVTRPPFNARGDGTTDDTQALRQAYDYVLDQIEAEGWDKFDPVTNRPSFILYFPNGTYLVRDTIIYTGAVRMHPVGVAEALALMRFIGESRNDTIIRLAPNTPAFAQGQPERPVLSFGKLDFNNVQSHNAVRNLTIRVGAGNPAAIGIKFGGANQSELRNVAIISEDPNHLGAVGLDDSIGTVLSYQRDVIVDGFDRGIRFLPYHFTHVTMEHVTLRNQRIAGVELVDGTAAIRALRSINDVPAIKLSGPGCQLVLLSSQLVGGAGDKPAVKFDDGHFFGRDLEIEGYARTLQHNGATIPTGHVNEYVSDSIIAFPQSGADASLNLPILEVPRVDWSVPEVWVKPQTPGNGATDASAAVQAAMNSDAAVVYLPGFEYRLDETVTIPCTVRRVQGLYSQISGDVSPKFRVPGNCDGAPLLIEDLDVKGGTAVQQTGGRPIMLTQLGTQAIVYSNNAPAAVRPTLFFTGVAGIKSSAPFERTRVFIRAGDGESPDGQLVADDSDVWVLGMKTEKAGTAFTAQNGARLEVLGTLMNQYTQYEASSWNGSVAILNQNAQISIVGCTNGPDQDIGFETLVRDTQGDTTFSIPWSSDLVVPREGRVHQEIIPLYVSH